MSTPSKNTATNLANSIIPKPGSNLPSRTESDSLGTVIIPPGVYYGASTYRSMNNFPFPSMESQCRMPDEIIDAIVIIKLCVAQYNYANSHITSQVLNAIVLACDDILQYRIERVPNFPLLIYQTGSGTHTNMNVNEVISNRCIEIEITTPTPDYSPVSNSPTPNYSPPVPDYEVKKKKFHPNDVVNMSQSSNDVFPTALHIASLKLLTQITIPNLKLLHQSLLKKSIEFKDIVKVGRTHMMDATPLTLGQEFSGYAKQVEYGILRMEGAEESLTRLALGGTAVGTGMNTIEGFDVEIAGLIADYTNLSFKTAPNKFEALAANDSLVEASSLLTAVVTSLFKIASDIRLLSSGPRCGLGEINIPSNEPGSSIMPGKINPTQVESLAMICTKVIGNNSTVICCGMNGQLELNVTKPVIGACVLESLKLVGYGCKNFSELCIKGITANASTCSSNFSNSLMLVTSLTPHIGYDLSAKIAKCASETRKSLRDAAFDRGVSYEQFDEWVRVEDMCSPTKAKGEGTGEVEKGGEQDIMKGAEKE